MRFGIQNYNYKSEGITYLRRLQSLQWPDYVKEKTDEKEKLEEEVGKQKEQIEILQQKIRCGFSSKSSVRGRENNDLRARIVFRSHNRIEEIRIASVCFGKHRISSTVKNDNIIEIDDVF